MESEVAKDSLNYYFLKSQKQDASLSDRLLSINQALNIYDKTPYNNIYGQLSHNKNWIHYSLGQYDSLEYYHKKLFLDSLDQIEPYYLAQQYYLMGYYFDTVDKNLDSAFSNYNRSKNYFEKIGDSSWTGRNLSNMGIIQKDRNDFFGSKETITEALQFLRPQSDLRYISSCYATLATNHRKLGNFEDAILYYKKAMETTDSNIDKFIFQNNMAACFIGFEKYKSAISILESVLEDSLLSINVKERPRALDNLAYARWISGENIDATLFLVPLKQKKENNDLRGQIASFTHLGEFYAKGAPLKAKQYLDTVIQLSKKLKIPRAEGDALSFLMQIEPKNVAIRNRFIVLDDSLDQQEQKVKTQFAKMKYDDEQKQADILRLEKDNAEKDLEASRQENQKLMSIAMGGLFLAISCFGIVLLVQRNKRLSKEKETAVLEASYKTEEELSRKLHDDFGSKLNTAMGMLQSKDDPSKVLDVLEDAYEQSRDFSRVINDVNTEANYKDELLAMLGSRNTSEVKLFTTGLDKLNWSTIPALTKTTLFKVLQELMINMGRHSEATAVVLKFNLARKNLVVEYIDDGKGASKEALSKKNGLRNTEKRIQAIGGSITFDSEEGNGFKATIRIPQ
ncbi:ATP-binding protein [Flagellimonas sp. DF-77]|uniref:tetratricopeptide repeat-containing sensor histidine kinase n=1 Tax=Flagellimonas algarum TaxID=3230298 RepID=UPI003396C234